MLARFGAALRCRDDLIARRRPGAAICFSPWIGPYRALSSQLRRLLHRAVDLFAEQAGRCAVPSS